jgi:hypothetical protein
MLLLMKEDAHVKAKIDYWKIKGLITEETNDLEKIIRLIEENKITEL